MTRTIQTCQLPYPPVVTHEYFDFEYNSEEERLYLKRYYDDEDFKQNADK